MKCGNVSCSAYYDESVLNNCDGLPKARNLNEQCGAWLPEPNHADDSPRAVPGSATKPGLTEAETKEYNDLLIRHIGEVTQEDWQKLHELNDKYIAALIEVCRK